MVYDEMDITIREFAKAQKQIFIKSDQRPSELDVRRAYESKGYVSVLLGQQGMLEWPEVHRWCCQQFGEQNYIWTGSRFWFVNDRDAALFALRWA